MSRVRVLSEVEEMEIVRKYLNESIGIEGLGKIYGLGKLKIKEIFKKHGVSIKLKGAQLKDGDSLEIIQTKSNVYSCNDDKKLVAICKKTGEIFDDANNLSGCLTNHILKYYTDVLIPSNTYQRKKYENRHGKKWFEEYFLIKEMDKLPVRHCRLCKWETEDIGNKTGCFENHLKDSHGVELSDFLRLYPDEEKYHTNYTKDKFRNVELADNGKSVICKICGEKMYVLSNTHLSKHNITAHDYRIKYGGKLMGGLLAKETGDRLKSYNASGVTRGKPSRPELELCDLIGSFDIKYKSGDRTILEGKEVDILIEDKKLCIEYNGNIHHTDSFGNKDRKYHLGKTELANIKGYGLIHIFSDEWLNKREIVMHKLIRLLNMSDSIKIGGRNCVISEIPKEMKDEFLNNFHIQGKDSSTVKLGAFFNTILVGVMTFKIQEDGSYDLTRFATNYNYSVYGLGSKLLKFFINNYDPTKIISFADRRWTINAEDNLYTKLGFTLIDVLKPDYRYFDPKDKLQIRHHKFGFRKDILIKKHPNLLNNSMTESEMVKILGYDRIWDCGLFKYQLICK